MVLYGFSSCVTCRRTVSYTLFTANRAASPPKTIKRSRLIVYYFNTVLRTYRAAVLTYQSQELLQMV